MSPRAVLSGTALSLDIPRGAALPFAASVAGAASPLAATAPMVDAPRGPTLPFAERSGGEVGSPG